MWDALIVKGVVLHCGCTSLFTWATGRNLLSRGALFPQGERDQSGREVVFKRTTVRHHGAGEKRGEGRDLEGTFGTSVGF